MRVDDLFEDDWAEYKAGNAFWQDVAPHFGSFKGLDWSPAFASWPPSQADLKAAERRILQHPQWLSRYAYFGWRNWSWAHDWTFDKHHQCFVFRNVPSISYHPKDKTSIPDRKLVYIDLSGEQVFPRGPSQYDQYEIPLPAALDACLNVVRDRAPFIQQNMAFVTGQYYVRFGEWPKNERSQNFLASTPGHPVYEEGVSAYHAYLDVEKGHWEIELTMHDDTITGTLESLFTGKRPVFLVQGDEIGEGADGEPLLHNVRKIKQLHKGEVKVSGVFDDEDEDE